MLQQPMSQHNLNQNDLTVQRAESLLRTGQFVDAAALFERILTQSPNNFEAIRGMAEACYALGDKSSSRHYLNLALQQSPEDPRSLNNSGVLLFHDKQYEMATEHLALAASIDPDFAEAHFNLCTTLGRLTLKDQESFIRPEQLLQSLRWVSEHAADQSRQELVALNESLRTSLLD